MSSSIIAHKVISQKLNSILFIYVFGLGTWQNGYGLQEQLKSLTHYEGQFKEDMEKEDSLQKAQ